MSGTFLCKVIQYGKIAKIQTETQDTSVTGAGLQHMIQARQK